MTGVVAGSVFKTKASKTCNLLIKKTLGKSVVMPLILGGCLELSGV